MPTEGDLPDSCWAWVPQGAPKSFRKLRLCDVATGKPDCGIIGNAAAALSSGGFRGNPVQGIPDSAMGRVKRLIRVARAKAKCSGDPPASIMP